LDNHPESHEAVAPVEFFTFGARARMILDGDFNDVVPGRNERKCQLHGERHVFALETHSADNVTAEHLVAGFHVG